MSLPRFSAQTESLPQIQNHELRTCFFCSAAAISILRTSVHWEPVGMNLPCLFSDHSRNCTAWSALISGMKAVLLKVKPWNLFERPLNWTYQTYQGSPSTERINVHFLSFSPNSKFNVRWDPTPPKTMLFWAENTVSLVFASTLASWVLGSKMMWNGSARKCLLQTKSRGPSQSRRMATAFRSSWQLSAWGLWDSLGR